MALSDEAKYYWEYEAPSNELILIYNSSLNEEVCSFIESVLLTRTGEVEVFDSQEEACKAEIQRAKRYCSHCQTMHLLPINKGCPEFLKYDAESKRKEKRKRDVERLRSAFNVPDDFLTEHYLSPFDIEEEFSNILNLNDLDNLSRYQRARARKRRDKHGSTNASHRQTGL